MMKANYEEVRWHLGYVLGIHLDQHLRIRRPGTLKHYSVIAALIVAYRYAEALGQKLVIHDMTTGGHKSHQVGTELDFDLDANPHKAVPQINMTSDLLCIREMLKPHLNAFRIGVYFDHLDNTDAKTYEEFKAMYGKVKYSMHLGVRYRWNSEEYKGGPTSSNYDKFSLWGKGSRHYGKKNLWAQRIRSWNIGLIDGQSNKVAQTILRDFITLDRYPPPLC